MGNVSANLAGRPGQQDATAFDEKRVFWRNPDDTKLYTQRFIRKLKAAHKKVIQKFVIGTIYALKIQKKMIMMRARAFVRATYGKVEETFKTEALILLEQFDNLKNQLKQREKELVDVLKVNHQLEVELSILTKQQDYLEVGLTTDQLAPRYEFPGNATIKDALMRARSCKLPNPPQMPIPLDLDRRKSSLNQEGVPWDQMSIQQRYQRAMDRRFISGGPLYKDKPNFENKVFNFYGLYTRINREQKLKYAETQIVMYYKDLCDEMIQRNESLMAELEIMLDMNETFRRNEKEF